MDKFLEMYNLSGLTHEEIENVHRLLTSKEIELAIKNLPTKKPQDQMLSLMNSYQLFKEEFMPILLELFKKN